MSLIGELPEGSRYGQRYHFDHREEAATERAKADVDDEMSAWLDTQFWTGDRLMIAQLINAVRELTMVTGAGKWRKGKEPEYPIVGPAEWRDGNSKNPADKKAPIADRLHKFFFGG